MSCCNNFSLSRSGSSRSGSPACACNPASRSRKFSSLKTASFRAINNATDDISTPVTLSSKQYDLQGGSPADNFTLGNTFTAPFTGTYHFDFSASVILGIDFIPRNIFFQIIQDSTHVATTYASVPSGGIETLSISTDFYLTVGDTVHVATNAFAGDGFTYFGDGAFFDGHFVN